MPRATLNGVDLEYEVEGEGPAIVLIGGSGMPAGAWRFFQVAALIGAGYRVITFGSRGVAPSQAPPPPYSIAEMAADTAALIEYLGIKPARVVGLSLGGFIAEALMHKRPDLVSSAILVASAGRTTAYARVRFEAERELFRACEVPYSYDMARSLGDILRPEVLQNDDVTVERWASLLAGQREAWAGPDGRLGQYQAIWAWLLDEDPGARWPFVRVPVLVVAFEHDLSFPPRTGREAAEAMPHGEFLEVRDATHNGAFEKPHEFNRMVLEFFAHP